MAAKKRELCRGLGWSENGFLARGGVCVAAEGGEHQSPLAQWADFATAECVVQCILERLCGNSVAWLWEDEISLAQSPKPLLPGAIPEEEAFCCILTCFQGCTFRSLIFF